MARPQKNRLEKPRYAVIVDGETEKWYLDLAKRTLEIKDVDIEPKIPKQKSLKDQYESVLQHFREGYDKVAWVVDMDVLAKENRDQKKGTIPIFQKFKQFAESLSKKFGEKVLILVNAPCLEFWYLLHFVQTSKYYDKCEDAGSVLKKHLEDYEKSEKYYKQEPNNIYQKLANKLPEAKKNARALGDFSFEEPESAKAEIYKIFGFFLTA